MDKCYKLYIVLRQTGIYAMEKNKADIGQGV